MRTYVLGGTVAIVATILLWLVPMTASATGLETVLQDDAQLLHRPEDQLRRSLEEMSALGVDRIRVTAGWSVLTRNADDGVDPVFDAADPAAYEQERWRNLDRLVVLAHEYGFRVMIDIAFWAPHWASADGPDDRGRTNIDAAAYAQFATAVARRYSGSFVIPHAIAAAEAPLVPSHDEQYLDEQYGSSNPRGGASLNDVLGVPLLRPAGADAALSAALGEDGLSATQPLPKVDVFTLWNEPNHPSFLRPQWVKHGRRYVPSSPHWYRGMVMAAYPAIKAARPDSTVLVGGTSFTGSYSGRGTAGIPPLRFLREMACVNRKLHRLKRSGCSHFSTVPGDGWSIHPYTMRTEPDARSAANHPDDVPIADLPKLAALMDRLIAHHRVAPGLRNLWVTEYGYETNPPVAHWIYSPGDQAHFLTWAEYLATKTPTVRSFAQFLLRDLPPGAFRVGNSTRRAFGQWQSGVEFENGDPKLAVYSFRAGLFAQELPHHRLRFWGRLRTGTSDQRQLAIQRLAPHGKQWHTVYTAAPGHRSTRAFTAGGDDSFERFGRAARRNGSHYRVRWLDGSVWRDGIAVPAVER